MDGKDITEGRSNFELSETADVEAAKAALAEAGYPDGEGFPTLQLSYYSDDNVKKIAEAIAEMWQQNLGITAEISSADWAVFYDSVQAGDYDVAAMGWGADYLNPMSFLPLFTQMMFPITHSTAIRAGLVPDRGGICHSGRKSG